MQGLLGLAFLLKLSALGLAIHDLASKRSRENEILVLFLGLLTTGSLPWFALAGPGISFPYQLWIVLLDLIVALAACLGALAFRRSIAPNPQTTGQSPGENDLYDLLARHSTDIICRHRLDSKCQFTSPACTTLTGFTPDEVVGESILDFLHPEELNDLSPLLDAFHAGKPIPPTRHRLRCKDGQYAWVETLIKPSLNPRTGAIEEIISVTRDVTESKGSEEALRSTEHQLRLMADALPALIAYIDTRRRFRFCNHACAKCFGQSREAMWGMRIDEVVGRDVFTALTQHVDTAITGDQTSFEFEATLVNGEQRSLHATFVPDLSEDNSVRGFYALMSDITERKALEMQLRQAQKMEVTGQLAGGIAHDFNNLLTAVIANVSLAHVDAPISLQPLLDEALTASYRAADHVKQLLTFSRKMPPALKRIDPNTVLTEVFAIVRNTFDRRIDVNIQRPGILSAILADAGQLHQVILNLCVNARDALLACRNHAIDPPSLSLTLTAENVTIDTLYCRSKLEAYPGAFVRLAVTDTGTGIDDKIKARMFEPFFTTKEIGKGTGLGLAMCYGIVKQHQGWIEVDSTVGQGTTVAIYVPALKGTNHDVSTLPSQRERWLRGGPETVLLVDDETQVREACRRILESAGYKVLMAVNGQHALDTFVARHGAIDLVILDLSMPQLSGFEALRSLRLFNPNLPVIISTGRGHEEGNSFLEQSKVSGLLTKPYQISDLLQMVRNILDSTSTTDPVVTTI